MLAATPAPQPTISGTPRVLVIPGIDGHTELLRSVEPELFPHLRPLYFDHQRDQADGGVDGLVDRAVAVLDQDAEGDLPAYICGESFGGTVALTLAHRYPHRVRGLILLSTFGWYPPVGSCGGEVGLRLWRVIGDRMADRVLSVGRPCNVFGALGFRFSRRIAQAYLTQSPLDMKAYRAKCEISIRFDARPWLSSISCPAIVVTGSWDSIVPISAGRELSRRIPNARLHRLSGGHLVYLVRAEHVGKLLSAWVTDTFGGADRRGAGVPASGFPSGSPAGGADLPRTV